VPFIVFYVSGGSFDSIILFPILGMLTLIGAQLALRRWVTSKAQEVLAAIRLVCDEVSGQQPTLAFHVRDEMHWNGRRGAIRTNYIEVGIAGLPAANAVAAATVVTVGSIAVATPVDAAVPMLPTPAAVPMGAPPTVVASVPMATPPVSAVVGTPPMGTPPTVVATSAAAGACSSSAGLSAADRLEQLESAKELLSAGEYESKRREIIDSL